MNDYGTRPVGIHSEDFAETTNVYVKNENRND